MSKERLQKWSAALCALLLISLWTACAHGQTVSEAPLYTVTYNVQEPVSGVWFFYFAEQVLEGTLARGPAEPMDPSGNGEQAFAGWYEEEDYTSPPVNLWRMPILSDMSLHARFGSEADVPVMEGLHPKITLVWEMGEEDIATITAELTDIPENVRYTLEWQNDLTGEFLAVPEENGPSITFPATEENLSCIWRLGIYF